MQTKTCRHIWDSHWGSTYKRWFLQRKIHLQQVEKAEETGRTYTEKTNRKSKHYHPLHLLPRTESTYLPKI